MDIKECLRKVGHTNGYQVYTIAFVCFKWMIVAFMIFGPSYMLMVPTFTCGTQTKVTEEDACSRISQCTIDNGFTITARNKLYCNDRYMRDGLLSSQYIGSVAGLIILSVLADKIGRKTIINITLLLSIIGTVAMGIGSYVNQYYLTAVGIVLMGLGGYVLSVVSFIYLGQVCSDRWRQVSIILSYTFWAVAQMLFYPVLLFNREWEFMLLATILLPLILLGIMSFWIAQTPQFLYNTSSKTQTLESLNYIARFNSLPQLNYEDLKDRALDKTEKFEVTDTISKAQFLLPVIILSFAQICNNGMYYITQYSINQIGSTFQMNMLIIGALQFIAYFITNLFCHKMKRKPWIIIFMLISAAIGILFQFVFRTESNTWDTGRWVETVVIGISRLANTFCFGLYSLITTESFPSSIKTTGTGITEAMSNLGNMAAPFIVTIADKFKIQSMFVGGIVAGAGALSMLFSKETLVEEPKRTESTMSEPLLRESTIQANSQLPEVQNRN